MLHCYEQVNLINNRMESILLQRITCMFNHKKNVLGKWEGETKKKKEYHTLSQEAEQF